MDIISFVVFTFNSRYVKRWIAAGLILLIPVANFLSLGYLARTCGLTMIGGIGLPTWERKNELLWEGAKLFGIFILYEALPCFLFSFSFLLSSFGNPLTAFAGGLVKVLAVLAFVVCSAFLPFAFCAFIEGGEARRAFEFERIAAAVKEVIPAYVSGYVLSLLCMYIGYRLHTIPYLLGFALSSVLIYYVLLVSTYYFTQLYRGTGLPAARMPQGGGRAGVRYEKAPTSDMPI
ncbi:MAG: DUF4013 domain-containing protein [Syntrophorhabdales bacterium]|jgi:hypothetical protein